MFLFIKLLRFKIYDEEQIEAKYLFRNILLIVSFDFTLK